jgi:hypothetical protein
VKPVVLTRHAADACAERAISVADVERAINRPDWTEPDPRTLARIDAF